MTTIMPPATVKTLKPRRKQKIVSEESKQANQNEAAETELPVAPAKTTQEEIAPEAMQNCEEAVSCQQLEESANFLNKIKTLQYVLELDILACDAKWTLFVAAAFSYRYDSLLQPFPPQFITDQLFYDVDALISVINDVPKLSIVLQILIEEAYDELSGEVIELLYWVLVEQAEPALRLVEDEELDSIINAIADKQLKNKPTHVFKVNAGEGFHCEKAFSDKAKNFPLKLAFIGNKLDTYYSLLQNGFPRIKESKNYLQLCTDFQTSLKQSPYCAAWGASQCGSIISCTAICEFPFNSEQDEIMANENDALCVNMCLSSAENVRLRYLIFYGRRFPRSLLPSRRIFSWIYNYRFSFSLLSYMFILLTIGLANSGKAEILRNYMSKQFDSVVAFFQRFVAKASLNLRF